MKIIIIILGMFVLSELGWSVGDVLEWTEHDDFLMLRKCDCDIT